jgi:hypothetical protein
MHARSHQLLAQYNVIGSAFPSAVDLVAKSFQYYNDPNNLYSGCGQYRF